MADAKSASKTDTDELSGKSLSELARRHILDGIRQGEYPPGSRIPEREVSEHLGISRTPVREAIRQLQVEGLLVIKPNTGAEVASLSLQRMIELYTFRRHLEEFAAAQAASFASPPEIELLDEIILQSANALEDMQKFALLNREFHTTIHRAARNSYLIQSLQLLDTNLALMPGWSVSKDDRVKQSHEEHLAVVNAIKDKDPEAATLAMRTHIENTQSSYLKSAIRSLS